MATETMTAYSTASVDTKKATQLTMFESVNYGTVYLQNFDQDIHNKIIDAYYGIGGFDDGEYLEKHFAESQPRFDSRKKLAAYDDLYQPEIDYKVLPVFSKPVERKITNKRVEAFSENVDRTKSGTTPFMKGLMTKREMHTNLFLVIDAPAQVSKSPLDDQKNLPYTVIVDPMKCSGYYYDSSGELAILTYQSMETDSGGQTSRTYRIWEKEKNGSGGISYGRTYTDQSEAGPTSTEPFKVKEFPVLLVSNGIKQEFNRVSPAKYRSTMGKITEMYNMNSWVKSSYQSVCFSPLLIQTLDGKLPSELIVGDDNAIGYASEMDAPSRLKVEIEHIKLMREDIAETRVNIQKNMDSFTQINDNSSGESRKEAARKIILSWMNTAQDASNIERWMFNTAVSNYVKSTGWKAEISYATDFATLTPEVLLEYSEKIADIFQLEGEALFKLFESVIKEVYGDDKEKSDDMIEAFKAQLNKKPQDNDDGDGDKDLDKDE